MMEYLISLCQENIVSTLLAIGVLLLFWWNKGEKINLPPGPRPLPIIGNLGYILNPIEGFSKLRKKYGDIFTLQVGRATVIVFNGYDTVKEVFVHHGDVTSYRPDLFFFKEVLHFTGLLASSGNVWKQHRSLSSTTLRDLGVGKKNMESKIMEELEQFLKLIESNHGKSFDLDVIIHTCIANIICSVVFGRRYEYDDPQQERLLKLLQKIDQNAGNAGIINFFPFLRHIPFDPFKGKSLINNTNEIIDFIRDHVRDHMVDLDIDNPRDFIDVYLIQMEKIKGTEDRQNIFTDEQLVNVVADIFAAGTGTTATAILWAILYFLHIPSVQNKMYEELSREIADGRFVSLVDKEKLPYCQAVITEVLRCGNIIPLSVPHAPSQEFVFRGYTIPKGAILMPNITSILNDDHVFKNPGKFNPDRYLDMEGKFISSDHVIAFSIGPRKCPGEHLARSELFLFLTNMVQRFQFKPEDASALPSPKGLVGLTNKPPKYMLRAVLRS